MKDSFLPKYSPTDSDSDHKLLDTGDKNIDNISEDYSLNEDGLLMPGETNIRKKLENCHHQKNILSKP